MLCAVDAELILVFSLVLCMSKNFPTKFFFSLRTEMKTIKDPFPSQLNIFVFQLVCNSACTLRAWLESRVVPQEPCPTTASPG